MRPVGDHAVLLDLQSNEAVQAVARLARSRFGGELVEVVPGHRTLLLVWDEGLDDAAALMSNLKALAGDARAFKLDMRARGNEPRPAVTVPVMYDGADLDAVAASLALSREGVVQLHAEAEYVVAFMGFSPGFPYLIAEGGDGIEGLLGLPRLATPRTEVPAGSVAVAAGYCGIYPRSSPGGWNLLGCTDVVLFDAQRDLPALLQPGTRVRFEPVGR
jgi:KipI family sensor histidine kinase inhibitor